MREDNTATRCKGSDFAGLVERNFLTGISGGILYLSGENRAERRKQKLRDEIVREHIKKEQKKPFIRWPVVNKLMRLR